MQFNVKNENLRKCRFFSKPRFTNFFTVYRRIAPLGKMVDGTAESHDAHKIMGALAERYGGRLLE
jgi:hypothetical protein